MAEASRDGGSGGGSDHKASKTPGLRGSTRPMRWPAACSTCAAVVLHNLLWAWVLARGIAVLLRGTGASGHAVIWSTVRALVAAMSSTLAVDAAAYFMHFLFANYFSQQGVLEPVLRDFLHRKSPKVQHQSFVEVAWCESILASSILLAAMAMGLCNLKSSFSAIFWGTFGFWGGQISAIHKAACVAKPSRFYALGQRVGLLVDWMHCSKHHATLDSNYSLCTGHFEVAFERLQGVACLEAALYLAFGSIPRSSRLGLRCEEGLQPRKTLAQRVQHLKWSIWYKAFNRFTTQADLGLHFMNWGYRRSDGAQYPLPEGAERVLGADPRIRVVNAASLQLYLHLLEGVPVEGLDVVEVSSGRGGFLACLAGGGRPRSCVGVDACAGAVETCNQLHADVPGLRYHHGDAMAPLSLSTDVLVNVEASHCYPSREVFFSRVHEALRAGGRFLFADFMTDQEASQCVEWLEADGRFKIEIREDITPAVLRAMEFTNNAKLEVIRERFPRAVRSLLERFAATEGSKSRGDTSDGWRGSLYLHLRAQKL